MKVTSLILAAVLLAAIACKQKPKTDMVFVGGNPQIKSMNVNAESFQQIEKRVPAMIDQLESLETFMAGFTGKIKYLPYDSLTPAVYPVTDQKEYTAYSINWSVATVNDRHEEGKDTIANAAKQKCITTRWSDVIKGQLIFPNRGVIINIEAPYAYHYNPFTGGYEYFYSTQNGSNCLVAISGPSFGTLAYPMHNLLNIDNIENPLNGPDGWADGIIVITERRNWIQYTNNKMKFVYPLNTTENRMAVKAEPGNTIKTTYLSSELYEINFNVKFKTPAVALNHKAVYTDSDFEYNNNNMPSPSYIVTITGKFMGNQHN